ncbi:MAG: hypothetical protein J6V44_12730 [Methanobrevibacter sp.]|nr:hypothetical protein [Methanobrevibacter sp.]
MKKEILELLNGMHSDSKSASYKCEKELCKILTSVIRKLDKIESVTGYRIRNYPTEIESIELMDYLTEFPKKIYCNYDNDFDFIFETKWLDYGFKEYFEELKRRSINSTKYLIESVTRSLEKHKQDLAEKMELKFEDLMF